MSNTESLLQGANKRLVNIESVTEVVKLFTGMGAKVMTVGLPKNGHDIFSVWFADIAGNNRVAIVPNKPWKEWLTIEKEEIELNIRDLVNATN